MTETPTLPTEPAAEAGTGPSRRQVLLTSGVVVAAAAVTAACGSSSSGTTSTPTSGGAGSSAASESAGSGSGAVTVKTADVPVGGGTILQDQKVVITQPTAGEYKAFTAVCTHQGCLVSAVKDDVISCPCHGSTFSAADGSVQSGPAQGALAEAKITVSGDTITLG